MEEETAAFEVRSRDGHVWKVFVNGKIEGFPKDVTIINRIHGMIEKAGAIARQEELSHLAKLGNATLDRCYHELTRSRDEAASKAAEAPATAEFPPKP